jgi:hypothetical protein
MTKTRSPHALGSNHDCGFRVGFESHEAGAIRRTAALGKVASAVQAMLD